MVLAPRCDRTSTIFTLSMILVYNDKHASLDLYFLSCNPLSELTKLESYNYITLASDFALANFNFCTLPTANSHSLVAAIINSQPYLKKL